IASLDIVLTCGVGQSESRQFTDTPENPLGGLLRLGAGGGEEPMIPTRRPVIGGVDVVVAGQTVDSRDPPLEGGRVEVIPRIGIGKSGPHWLRVASDQEVLRSRLDSPRTGPVLPP